MADIFNALSAIPEGILAFKNHPRAALVVLLIVICAIVGVKVSSTYTYEQKAADTVPVVEDPELIRIRTDFKWSLNKEEQK